MATQLEALWPADLATLSPEILGFVRAIVGRPDFAERLAKMALMFRGRNKKADALLLAKAARARAGGDYRVRVLTEWVSRREAPLWHFRIVHDRLRNDAYARAIRQFVKPGMTVFEIGTGTGILAMLAAQAGAAHVFTCERRVDVAEAARAIIARNGYAERITVISKDAHEVRLGVDMPVRADVFVAEIVDNSLLGEGLLPLTELARTRFLSPDAILLPRAVSAIGCLVSGRGHHESYRMDTVMGFDLTPFNCFMPLEISAGKGGGVLDALSEPQTLLQFDLHTDAPTEATLRLHFTATCAGRAEGVMRWLRLDFGDGIVFENAPPQHSSWDPQLHIFPEARWMEVGERLEIEIFHSREHLFLMPTSV